MLECNTHVSQELRIIVLNQRRANKVGAFREPNCSRIDSAGAAVRAISSSLGDSTVDGRYIVCDSVANSAVVFDISPNLKNINQERFLVWRSKGEMKEGHRSHQNNTA